MSEKAEAYINRQTARHVLTLIIKDIEKIGGNPDMDDIKAIVKRLETVKRDLIGV